MSLSTDDAKCSMEQHHKPSLLTQMSPSVMLKILAFDDMQHRMTSQLGATGDSLIRTLLEYASTDYTMKTCAGLRCISKCYCIRFGRLQLPNITSLSIIVSSPRYHCFFTCYKFSLSSEYMLTLPPKLKRLRIGNDDGGTVAPWWNLQSNLIPRIPNASNLLLLDIMCSFRKSDYACFSSFINLQTLRVNILNGAAVENDDAPSLLSHLPPNLTAFSCKNATVENEQVASSLPRNLTALSINGWKQCVPKFPYLKSVTFLQLKYIRHLDEVLDLPANLECFRTIILGHDWLSPTSNMMQTKWPDNLTDLDVRFTRHIKSRCSLHYPPGLVYLRKKVIFNEESIAASWSTPPFAACSSTLVTLNLEVHCKFDPDYFALESLVALTHLEIHYMQTIPDYVVVPDYDVVPVPELKLCRLPPNLQFLNAQYSYLRPAFEYLCMYVVQHDPNEKYPMLKQIALRTKYADNSFSDHLDLDITMSPSSFPSLAHLNLNFNGNDSPYSASVCFNTNNPVLMKKSSSEFWFNMKIVAGSVVGVTIPNARYDKLYLQVPRVPSTPSPWEMKHYI